MPLVVGIRIYSPHSPATVAHVNEFASEQWKPTGSHIPDTACRNEPHVARVPAA